MSNNSYRRCPSEQTSNRSSGNDRDNFRPKYQLLEVDHCGLHGGHGGYLSLVVSWLQRAFCCHREVRGPTDSRPAQVQFPKKLVVFVEHDRDGNVYAVLETPSSSLSPKTHIRDNVTDILTRLYGSQRALRTHNSGIGGGVGGDDDDDDNTDCDDDPFLDGPCLRSAVSRGSDRTTGRVLNG